MNSRKCLFILLSLSIVCLSGAAVTIASAEDEHSHEEHAHDEHEKPKEPEGFKLTPEAFKNFGVQLKQVSPGVVMTLSKKSIFFGLEERNLYRYRNGFFKRIDFKTHSKTKTEITVSSDDLQAGDQIATAGLGFLRIAELAAFGGVSEGHSH